MRYRIKLIFPCEKYGFVDTDKKKHTMRDDTNQFISDLEKSLNDFEDRGDVDKLKENLERIIHKFRKN